MSVTLPSLADIFGVVTDGQTYKNLLYLLLAFPLGLFYYVGLTIGLAFGVALAVFVVGIAVLFATVLGSRLVATFERWLANTLLDAEIADPADVVPDGEGVVATAKAYLAAGSTWRGLGFLLVKFWLGVVSFVLLVTLLGTAVELLLAPVAPGLLQVQVGNVEVSELVETPPEMALGVVAGAALAVIALHVLNVLADVSERVAVALLGPGNSTGRTDDSAEGGAPGASAGETPARGDHSTRS